MSQVVVTVSQAKGKQTCPGQVMPRPGTRIRNVYDILFAAPGQLIEAKYQDFGFKGPGELSVAIEYLRNFYGLDIRLFGRRGRGVTGSVMLLAGEWRGRDYCDFVAKRLE
jgi:hypothetical protein